MKPALSVPLLLIAALSPAAALAAPWPLIAPVTSEVFEAPGSARELAARGSTCMARILRPGIISAPTIISTDLEGGQVVANNAYETPGLFGEPLPSRSKATFEAKEGRFRLVFTDLEEMPTPQLGWQPLRGRKGPEDAPRTIAILKGTARLVASCVQKPAEDW